MYLTLQQYGCTFSIGRIFSFGESDFIGFFGNLAENQEFPCGLAVRIPGFHPGGPGSTPGMGNSSFFWPRLSIERYLNFFP